MRRVNLIGIELEGGWDKTKATALIESRLFKHDGSVSGTGKPHQGEVASPPGSPSVIEEFMRKWYPDGVNHTCGMHIHVSLNSALDYSRLMSRTFHRHFRSKWTKWGHENKPQQEFWDRLKGKNRFCQAQFGDPDLQAVDEGDRYRQLNFCHRRHGTVESRLLPMFNNVDMAVKAMHFTAEIFEKWLSMQKRERGITRVLEREEEPEQIGFGLPHDLPSSGVNISIRADAADLLKDPAAEKIRKALEKGPMTDAERFPRELYWAGQAMSSGQWISYTTGTAF